MMLNGTEYKLVLIDTNVIREVLLKDDDKPEVYKRK